MPSLHGRLQNLAATFAADIVAAISGASLADLLASEGGRTPGNGRTAKRASRGGGAQPEPVATPKKGKGGRLARRTPAEIDALLGKIILLVKTQKNGLRAEEIRSKLGLEPKEMPRVLKQGISSKKLTTKGQKRATTYFAK
jgi:hypothetical protein